MYKKTEQIDMLVSDNYYTRGENPIFYDHVPSANLPEANSTFWRQWSVIFHFNVGNNSTLIS